MQTDEPIDPVKSYFSILNNLDANYPGRGIDIFNDEIKDRPMAYGLILSAEANRYMYTSDTIALYNVRKCGYWLIKNSDLNDNGIKGYGLADPWDAFSDGSVNPTHQEYTITTAIVVKGLMDWYEIEMDLIIQEQIIETIEGCLNPFLDDTYNSPSGMPAYSFNENDKIYDDFNPASFLAGQLQRFSTITNSNNLSASLEHKADTIISVLIQNSHSDQSEYFYWFAAIQIKRPNDLLHAVYIIKGFKDYYKYGGKSDVEFDEIFNHLFSFRSDGFWYEHFKDKNKIEKKFARLWALGILIYTLSEKKLYDIIEDEVLKQLSLYQAGDGIFKIKPNDNRMLIRYDAHLLLGLSHFLYNSRFIDQHKSN